jgi:predicted nucleic acid-binding protein
MALSPQAINELFASLLRLKVPLPVAIEMAQNSLNFAPHPIDQAVVRRALLIFERYQTSWWDALMIGWAAQAGCSLLLTEDRQSAPDIEGVAIVSPFDFAPVDLDKLLSV